MASGPARRWIFWFLAIVSGICLVLVVLLLPETNRALVGNGAAMPRSALTLFFQGYCGLGHDMAMLPSTIYLRGSSGYRSPSRALFLTRKDVAVTIMPGSFLYTVYCCIHTSLSTSFVQVYHLDYLRAGFVYLPFGVGAIISTIASGKLIDRDYRTVAKSHGLPINKVSGDDVLQFPVEEARLRIVFLPTLVALVSVVTYGWLVDQHVVSVLVPPPRL